jgi:uncharacterized protein YegJ (DUF2314 family)
MKLLWLSAATLGLLCFVSCSPKTPTSSPQIPAGSLMGDEINFQFAIYYLPNATNDPGAVLDALLSERYHAVKRVRKLEPGSPGISVSAKLVTNVQQSYRPPSLESLKYFGRGLSREQGLALQGSQQALLLDFAYSKEHVWDGMRLALELTGALTQQTGGLPWDDATREVFTPDAWKTNRIDTWNAAVPDISRHTVMHAYRDSDKGFVRAITLGMAKFGLPDLVIEDFLWSENRNIGHLINLFAQALAEGASVTKAGEFDLDIRGIKNFGVRDPDISSLKTNGTGKAFLSLRQGRWEQGDPQNRLIEITFDRYKNRDPHARQEELLSSMFGAEDHVTKVHKDDAQILAASKQAREKLPALREHFNKEMKPGEYVVVKVPFATPDGGKEYMWVEISTWNGDKIKGLLRNDPENVSSLHAGQMVTVSEAKVFDYIHLLPDGTQEGNETGKIIEAQEVKRN